MGKETPNRQNFIGASDIPALFNLEPYWCKRKLWFEKRGQQPDYPAKESYHIRRGIGLEPLAAEEYQKKSGRQVAVIDAAQEIRHPKLPFLMVHPDRIHTADGTPLEIKCPTLRIFEEVKRNGLPEAYILQVQTQILVMAEAGNLKLDKGTLAMFCAEIFESWSHDDPYRPTMADMILAAVMEFWYHTRKDEVGPEKLPLKNERLDNRCAECIYRKTCQGEAMSLLLPQGQQLEGFVVDNSLSPLVQKYWQAKEIYDEAETYLEEIKTEIKTAMGERVAVECVGGRIYYRPYGKTRTNYRGLLREIPLEIVKKYRSKEIQRPLRIYPI